MAEILIPVVALAGAAVLSSMDKKKQLQKHYNNYNNFINDNKGNSNKPVAYNSNNNNTNNQLSSTKISENKEGFTALFQPISNKTQPILSETQPISKTVNFNHINMVPFATPKNMGSNPDTSAQTEAILDNKMGANTYGIKRDSQAPLFKPEENVSWNNGAPINTDFFQSRINVPNAMNNVILWDQMQVGPGPGGYNSGLNERDQHLPRKVDELRADNKPRETFLLDNHQGPAQSRVKNPGILGRIEKKLPDTTFSTGPDRWLTTTGAEIRPTNRSIIQESQENRGTNQTNFFGGGNNNTRTTYANRNFRDSNRQQLDSLPITNVSAGDRFQADKNSLGVKSFRSLPNNRSTTQHDLPVGGVSGVVSSIMAPINDILRPSRKENAVGNARISGNINGTNRGSHVISKNNRPRTTIRDTTANKIGLNHLNFQNQSADGYITAGLTPVENQRDTTTVSYMGGGNSQNSAMRNIDGKLFGVNNNNKTAESRINIGNTNHFLGSINAQTSRNDNDIINNRSWNPTDMPYEIPSVKTMGAVQPLMFNQSEHRDTRLDEKLLSAFKSNPYTQSLNSIVDNIKR